MGFLWMKTKIWGMKGNIEDKIIVEIPLYGKKIFSDHINRVILISVTECILLSKRFDDYLSQPSAIRSLT